MIDYSNAATPVESEPRIPAEHRAVIPCITEGIAFVMTNRFDVVGIVDMEDAGLVDGYTWSAFKSKTKTWYLQARINGQTVRMHTLLTGYPETDHVNRDATDNRRSNLRPATRSQNNRNQPRLAGNSSGLIGVSWHKGAGKWQAGISINNRIKHLGLFEDRGEAAIIRDKELLRVDPDFGVLNYPILRDIYLAELSAEQVEEN